MSNPLFMGYGPQLLIVDSADFDGSADYMLRGADLTGSADGKSGTISVWIRIDGGDGGLRHVIENGTVNPSGFALQLTATGVIKVLGKNASDTDILSLPTSGTYAAAATWLHVLSSWDLANGLGTLYINDVSALGSTTLTDDTIDYTRAEWMIGGSQDGALLFNGCIAELWFAQNSYIDLSIVANRRKFISGSGKPVWLGADGSAPTGTAPIVYQRVADGAAVATFATNLGSGGNFSITGTLATGSTSPSD